ncbi:MAG TPA: hypothetical protein VK489_05910, partial [Ferruginibacter sp.]|nr:hypothetical protein [Ferruginibacter sp.]
NWLEIENILVLAGKRKWPATDFKTGKLPSLKTAKDNMTRAISDIKSENDDMDFWEEISVANAALCLWLLEGKNTKQVDGDRVADTYMSVWNMAGSQNKKMAEIEHFDFLIDAYSHLVKLPKMVKTFNKIKTSLKNSLK